jgi:hypothetical protein
MCIGMTHRTRLGLKKVLTWDETTVSRLKQRRLKLAGVGNRRRKNGVLLDSARQHARRRGDVPPNRNQSNEKSSAPDYSTLLPPQTPTNKSMQHEEPNRGARSSNMCPENNRSRIGVVDSEFCASDFNSHEEIPTHQQHYCRNQKTPPHRHGSSVWSIVATSRVRDAVDNHGHSDQKPKDEVHKECPDVGTGFKPIARPPLDQINRTQIHTVNEQ